MTAEMGSFGKIEDKKGQSEKKVKAFTLAAIVLLIAAFFSPVWWVSLTAPNYPKDAFPDGIKILFSFTGVSNGCKIVEGLRSQEIYQGDLGDPQEEETQPLGKHAGLDCVHEMDTINHYVGMYPIITGATVEQAFSKYLFAMMVVFLLGFMFKQRKIQLSILAAGFTAVGIWIFYSEILNEGIQTLITNYETSLGTYFKDAERIAAMSADLNSLATISVYGMLGLMVLSLVGTFFFKKLINVFPLIIAFIPVYFILDFGGWLWYFGHNLHPWGAFTLKPFMPTVFGEGKVAQFATFSYPHYGFLFLVLTMCLLLLAFLIRRKNSKED